MPHIIEAINLSKSYGRNGSSGEVLHDVSFALERGEFLCIMGPSGSGKTTLLHLLSGLDGPTEGRVRLDGRDLGELAPHEVTLKRRETVGQVFQFFNLMPNLTCIENVGLPLAIEGRDPAAEHDRIAGLLDRFGLTHRADALPHQLSGGEMQRTSIARALAGGQPVILCDEPTGNLSQKAGLEVMQALRELCDRDGKSILLVTHNPRDATFADRVLFLVDGRLAPGAQLTGPGLGVEQVHEVLASLEI